MRYLTKLSSLYHIPYREYFLLIVTPWNRHPLHTNTVNPCNTKDTDQNKEDKTAELPEPPTNCCFSGCANCVWIKYAEELSEIFTDAEDKVKESILSKIEDPNMKAFLLMELQSVKFKK